MCYLCDRNWITAEPSPKNNDREYEVMIKEVDSSLVKLYDHTCVPQPH